MKLHPYACAYCQESFTTPSCLVIHVQNKHVKAEHSMESESNLIEPDVRRTVEGQNTYACSFCQDSFVTPNYLASHVQNKHVKGKHSVENESNVIGHDVRATVEYQSNSNKKYEYDVDSTNNKSFHKKKKNHLSCKFCGKIFLVYNTFYQHSYIHKEKRHSCEICKKKFTYGEDLKRHMRIHSGEKPYACKFCNKKFKQTIHKMRHEKTHSRK